MLERAGMSDRIKSVMGLIRRYESLFQLPTRIVQETERGDFETVCSSCHVSSANLTFTALVPSLHARLAAMQCVLACGYRLFGATIDFPQPAAIVKCHQLQQHQLIQGSTHSI